MNKRKNNESYFLVYDETIKNLGVGEVCEFYNWLKIEGFTRGENSNGFWIGVGWLYVNVNSKQYVAGMPGIERFDPIGAHAITIDEFKAIYKIYKKYEGKRVLEF